MLRRRIWCETAPREVLGAPGTVELLRRFAVHPILAVWPETLAEIGPIAARYADAGLEPALWPMLADAEGRWVNADNVAAFVGFVTRVADEQKPREIVLDLEPSIERVKSTLAGGALSVKRLSALPGGPTFQRARAAMVGLVDGLRARGIAVSAAVPLPVLFDPKRSGRSSAGWQEQLGTPVDGVAWDHVSPMLYTSILEGWSRGALRRADVRHLLSVTSAEAVARFGTRAGASLGAVGTGAFGDEPTYRDVSELADDVAITRAAGLDNLALFDLGGVLRRAPAEAWLEAFVSTPPSRTPPPPTLRSRATIAAARAAGAVLGVHRR